MKKSKRFQMLLMLFSSLNFILLSSCQSMSTRSTSSISDREVPSTVSELYCSDPENTNYSRNPAGAEKCEVSFTKNLLDDKQNKSVNPNARDTKTAWTEASQALKQIDGSVYNRKQVIESLATAILAKEFVWINGEPGGAKTYLSRMMFKSVLNSISEKDKKIFVLQFHKLISEGKITGFQKFSSMMKDGKYEIETSSSLVGDKFLFLIADEAEKSNPAVLNALLSVLNERKAFLGSKVVESILSSGVFTSNKTTGEFIQGFYADRPSGEALLDRMAIKIHIPNQQGSSKETAKMYDLVKNPQDIKINLPLKDLEAVVQKVKINEEMMKTIVEIARNFDRYVTDKADKSKEQVRYGERESEYFPANQFSNRSVRRLVQVFKSAFISHQLMEGVPFDQMRIEPGKEDLSLLAKSALYVGPSEIKLKSYKVSEVKDNLIKKNGVVIENDLGVKYSLQADYSPYDGKLFLQDLSGQTQIILKLEKTKDGMSAWKVLSKSNDFKNYDVDSSSLEKLNSVLNEVISKNKIDLKKPQFEVDSSGIDELLAKGTVKERTQKELESIKEDLNQFAETLNQQFDKPQNRVALTQEKLLPPRSAKEIKTFQKEVLKLNENERVQRYYDWMVYEVRALKQRFIELDHSIEAHLTGILSENHLYVFGPPGGAKTALAEVILKSELKKLNHDELNKFVQRILLNKKVDQSFIRGAIEELRAKNGPKAFDRFLLQFHKLLPEGVLVGFPKIEKQLNDGVEEIETSTSLASEKFIFAILDEVDKANPQTITALLSILNEREVFAGSQVIKTALRTAILTSNKMPSEFLDSYQEDRSTGEAVMDRAPNKVFVSNKISTEEELTKFLMNLEKGISPNWKGLLGVGELKSLVNDVQFENDVVKEILAKVHEKFLSKRLKAEEESRKSNQMDAREFPDYYVSASGSASDRTFIKLVDQFKARFIVHQMMQGVAFKDIKTVIQLKDINLFFEGLGYWAPQKITADTDSDGNLEFKNDSHVLEKLISSGNVDRRVKYHLEQMKEEAKDFSQIATDVTNSFMSEYKAEIAKHKDIFPMSEVNKNNLDQTIQGLASLRLTLEQAKMNGEKSQKITALTQDYQVKEAEIKREIIEKKNLLTESQFKEKFKTAILDIQKDQARIAKENQKTKATEEVVKVKQQEEVKEALDPVNLAKKITLHEIKPGKFKMGEIGAQVDVEITKPFEMQETQVTQLQWAKLKIMLGEKDIAKIAPSYFKSGTDAQAVNIDGVTVTIKPDHPVEQISYDDIQELLKGLNQLSQNPDAKIQKELKKLIPGHKQNDVYDLPTSAQWEFVMRDRGNANKKHFDRDDESQVGDYGWYSGNSNNETQAVATKLPRVIDRGDGTKVNMYDLEGNVWEWNKDWYDSTVKGGVDPQGPKAGSRRVLRGGSWGSSAASLRSGYRGYYSPGDRYRLIGFRLSRTRP